MSKNTDFENDSDGSVIEKTDLKTKKPPMYKVILLNDDFTPMEFVVTVLEKYFKIGRERAISIMLDVHQKGLAIVGVYSNEVAETKVTQVMDYAKKYEHPLQCTMEKE